MARPRKQLEDMEFDGWICSDPHLDGLKIDRNGHVLNTKTGNVLKPYVQKKGHLQVSISKNGVVKKYLVHRLVAKAFIPNPENKPCVNHLNGNPADNRVENLEWCTDLENKAHAKRHRLFQQSTKRYNAKFDSCQVLTIHSLAMSKKLKTKEIGEFYGVCESVISRILNVKTYSNFAVIYEK